PSWRTTWNGSCDGTWPDAKPASVSRSGPNAPRKASSSEHARRPFPLPLLRRGGPASRRGRRLAVHRLPTRLLGHAARDEFTGGITMTPPSTTELRELAERAGTELVDASATEVLRWTVDTFGTDFVVASNMQNGVLIDLTTQVKSDVDVLFLDTGYHFAETLGTRQAIQQVYPDITIINAEPEHTVAVQDAEHGPRLYERDPNRCCHLRKVVPLRNTLANYSCWVTGVR